jgi:hypothetical protein
MQFIDNALGSAHVFTILLYGVKIRVVENYLLQGFGILSTSTAKL